MLQDSGNTTTLAHYLDLLNSAGLLAGLEKFAGNYIRQRQSSPKFQVHNTALIAALRPESFGSILNQPEEWGRVVESTVGAHLLNHARREGFQLYYGRDGNDEVDYIVVYRGKTLAIEVKSGTIKNTTSGMESFRRKHKPDKMLLVGSTGLLWPEFLEINPVDFF